MTGYKPSFKILMTADTVGGVWTYCMELCHAFQAHDIEIHLVTMGAKMNECQKAELDAFHHVVVYETDYRLEWMQDPWNDLKECGEWLMQLEAEINPDIIHLNCFAYGSLPFKAPVIVMAHSDVYSWFLSVKRDDPPVEWSRYHRCVKEGLNGSDLVVAPSQVMMDYIRTIYSITTESRVIYNSRNSRLFFKGTKQPTIFSMGRLWDEAKNTKLLVDAAPLIGVPVKIAGDYSFEQNHFDSNNKVIFLGKLSPGRVAEELSFAAIYVLPAKYEPFGLSALEAALSGCALLLGDIPSLREIWEDAAIYVDTNDAKALANTIKGLMKNKKKLTLYQSRAFSRARVYRSAAMADQYLELYHDVLHQKQIFLKQEAV
jgi:glycogen synthase